MSAAALIPELETVLAHGSDEKRTGALRAITTLFLESADRLNDEQLRLFDEIFIRLIAGSGTEARQELSRRLARVANPPPETIRRLAGNGGREPVRDFSAAQEKVRALVAAHELDEAKLAAIAQSRDYEETVAALSALTAVPVDVVDRLMHGERRDPILILCKALRYSWPTARAIVFARRGDRDEAAISLDTLCANFHDLSESTARRVMQFWQMAPGSLRAAG